jgi:dienelactone hydrolase
MHAILAKPMDWFSIQLARFSVHVAAADPVQVDGAQRLLAAPDLFLASAAALPDVQFSGAHDFRFVSPLESRWPANNMVHGRFFAAARSWRGSPTVILLHGWNAESTYRTLFPYLAWRLNRAGLNAAMIELPYHSRRKPRGAGAVRNFLSNDLVHVLEATRQSVADARALVAWLTAEGSPAVSLWGFSLGAWLSGLVVCTNSQISRAVLTTPVSRIDRVIDELDFCKAIRQRLDGVELCLDPLNLVSHRPAILPENILLVASEHDLFAPIETIEELRRAWGGAAMWRTPHGHISALMSAPIMERTVNWLARPSDLN